jgi:hypothetical protein
MNPSGVKEQFGSMVRTVGLIVTVGAAVGEAVKGMSTKNAGWNASGASPYTDMHEGSKRVQ